MKSIQRWGELRERRWHLTCPFRFSHCLIISTSDNIIFFIFLFLLCLRLFWCNILFIWFEKSDNLGVWFSNAPLSDFLLSDFTFDWPWDSLEVLLFDRNPSSLELENRNLWNFCYYFKRFSLGSGENMSSSLSGRGAVVHEVDKIVNNTKYGIRNVYRKGDSIIGCCDDRMLRVWNAQVTKIIL
jgi:hypothetical protein